MLSRIPPKEVLSERIGTLVKQRYRLDALIGAGGQGAVYRALDLVDGREVAVKVLHEESDRDPTSRERLKREAHALEVTVGTAAVQLYDQAFTSDGRICLVTELLQGMDLAEALARRERAGMRAAPHELSFLFEPIVATLDRAHAHDIVHRDLKPENVFLQQTDGATRVRLMDFGFARFQKLKPLTVQGFVAGSPSYIAPEIWQGQPVTTGADVYALGAMMYRVLAGRTAAPSEVLVEVFRWATSGPRPSLHALRPDLPAAVDAWVEQALAIAPAQRFPSPRATLDALLSALA
jgi:serine/threonine-protein kinase